MNQDTIQQIADELDLSVKKVAAAIELLESGNTIPFIARYRKERTGSLDETALREIEDALERAVALAARKATVLKSIDEQGLLSADLRRQIEQCLDLRNLEVIYLPYRPKRRTRASIARERGLQPLADQIVRQQKLTQPKQRLLQSFVDPDRDLPDPESALAGALDIIAEQWSEDAATRSWLTQQAMNFGTVTTSVKRGKKSSEGADKFEQYFDRRESVKRIPGHRLLAMMRGSAEGVLRIKVQLEGDRELSDLKRKLVDNRQFEFFDELIGCVQDCYERLLMPGIESAVLGQLKDRADAEAIKVFGKNLHELLMTPPAGGRVTMGIDPGFRSGCKVAVVDQTGKFLANETIFPTPPKNDAKAAGATLLSLIKKHGVELIAIGNGTASRETDAFVSGLIKEHQLDVTKVMVSESGASIYSASEVAVKEFPRLDITVRGAISIARRLQDPLAELVKTDPKSIGVGQYQHDVNQAQLRKCLDRTVESCVNQVGVDLNTASASLLAYVSGIGPKLAEQIVGFRDSNGPFKNRSELIAVPKLGKKAFEQSAGFLRIRNGDQPLDRSAVHPECYPIVRRMAERLGTEVAAIVGNTSLCQKIQPEEYADDRFGIVTMNDLVNELSKPGRDPRSEFRAVQFDESINDIADLKPNLVLQGVITNVTHFGAFVDLGVHHDGLIHVSQLADEFVSDPNAVVSVGDVVRVRVLDVDLPRKRISLTRKA